MGASYHSYRVNRAVIRGREIKPAADEFFTIELPADYQLGETVGASDRPIEEVSDKSATATINCGAKTIGQAEISEAYIEQQVIKAAGGNPTADHIFVLSGGHIVTGPGVISKPTSLAAGVGTGANAWTVMLSSHTFRPAVGLRAELAAAGSQ